MRVKRARAWNNRRAARLERLSQRSVFDLSDAEYALLVRLRALKEDAEPDDAWLERQTGMWGSPPADVDPLSEAAAWFLRRMRQLVR